ncbi:hypothetical protein RN001_007364 [Aquatica leii]|uniref:Golgi apparatus protein 1 n=1 Tax=Aquatica leii TaxID=1421715 RepID=A0AAN7P9F2_9COLE|nr:hypothetical protein RN001_007364 [Aquatica leii]
METTFYVLCFCLFTLASTRDVNRHPTLFDDKCRELSKLCRDMKDTDEFSMLDCLYSLDPNMVSHFNNDCHQVIWNFVSSMIENDIVEKSLAKACSDDLQSMNCHREDLPGSYLKCVVNNKDGINDPKCLNQIEQFENAAFYDYEWIGSFLQNCEDDVKELNCGRIDLKGSSQAMTIMCLQDNIGKVKESCRKEVFHLAEIQADNIKLDHQLYLACAEDQNKYCPQFFPGSGRIFKCLMQHRHEKLTVKCFHHLQRRQKLISQDYKISKGLMKACREDIKKAHCRKQTSDDKEIRLAQILICLQNIMHNGTKVDPDCEIEMDEHRKLLMEDYNLSPEIVNGCAKEIRLYCNGLEAGGKTIHCLMQHAQWKYKSKRISPVCERALEDLVKETVVGEDWRVDPVLHEACNPVVRAMCRDVRGGNARVVSCLLDNIGADHMTEDCEDALMQIQYFVSRNFKLDPQLYKACHDDATRLCHVNPDWENSIDQTPENGPLVLPCLYRYMYHPEEKMQLKAPCTEQIRRVMRQRAISVNLLPEIEEVCLLDLSAFCADKTAKGEELQCLQKNLADLQEKCKGAIINYTEVEAQNVDLNPFIVKYCKKPMETHCSSELKHDDGDMMECLIAHKNDPDVKANMKCRVSIEHFQIISIKDYRFSYKFKVACKNYIIRYCSNAKSKAEVVWCLSEKIRNDTVNGLKSDIHKECRQQIKAQLFQQRENINFDPKLKEACLEDVKDHCNDVERGSSQVLECLQLNYAKLKETCKKEIFKIKKQELTDNSIDYVLIRTCQGSIQQFCPNYEMKQVLECLKKHKDEIGFNKVCRFVVLHRMIEQNTDYRFNPFLQENCKADINKFCQETIMRMKPDEELNGEVIKCLKEAFKRSKLSNKCEKEMAAILREQALDVQLNPLLKAVCKNELETICKTDIENDAGSTEECLKNALLQHKIPTAECQVEVANMIEESHADIQVDPLLQQTCSVDLLKYCREIVQGQGRHIRCLKNVLNDNPNQLEPDCKNMLKKRLEMYKNAVEVAPVADLQGLYNQVAGSPSKHYFFLIGLMAIASFFVIGMFCGRVTKRQLQSKNK